MDRLPDVSDDDETPLPESALRGNPLMPVASPMRQTGGLSSTSTSTSTGGGGGGGNAVVASNSSSTASLASSSTPAPAPSSSLRSNTAVRERLEPLLAFLEEERVLHPCWSLQYRRALTVPDRMEQLRMALEQLPIGQSEVDRIVRDVANRVGPAAREKGSTLADALGEASPGQKGRPSVLDSKSEKYVRRYLDQRRHFYRERRVTRVTKLLTDLLRSEEQYLQVLRTLVLFRQELSVSSCAEALTADEIALVFTDLAGVVEVHQQFFNVVKQATTSNTLTSDAIAQRAFILECVLEPLAPCLRAYGAFFASFYLRSAALQRWSTLEGYQKVLPELEKKHQAKLSELLAYVVQRIEGYKGLVERLEVLLEEERAPLDSDRRKEDMAISERVQSVCASLQLECARLQMSIARSKQHDVLHSIALSYKLGEAFVSANPQRSFVCEDRARVLHRKTSYDDCAILLFSDVVLIVQLPSKNHRVPKVLATLDLASCELEEDNQLSWADDSSSSLPGIAPIPVDGKSSEDSSSKGRFGGLIKSRKEKIDKTSTEVPESAVTPDVQVLTSQSASFALSNAEGRWQLQFADRKRRLAMQEELLGQKYKYRSFGVSISFLAERDGDAVPEVVRTCARELRRRATEEGVFRIPGRAQFIDSVVKSVNSGMRVDVAEFPTHDVAGIFKIWFRLLPAPVVPRPLLPEFVATNRIVDPEERAAALRSICDNKLPSHNLRVLSFTLSLLNAFHNQRASSKMDADNLATIFAPALFFCLNQDQSKEEVLENAKLGPDLKNVISFMIANLPSIIDDLTATLKTKLLEAADIKKQ